MDSLVIGLSLVFLITGMYTLFLLRIARRTQRTVPIGPVLMMLSAGLGILSSIVVKDVPFHIRLVLSSLAALLGIIGVLLVIVMIYRRST